MAEERAYSIWVPVEGGAGRRMAAHISELARVHGGPAFAPHVTVLGRVAGSRDAFVPRLARLARGTSAFTVALDGIGMEREYFRALYAHARAEELPALRARAEEAFGVAAGEPYRPHVSLFYGDIAEPARAALAARLEPEVHLCFRAGRLELWDTAGPVLGWSRVAVAALAG